MPYFWYTEETIPLGVGFTHYGPVHLFWLGALALTLVGGCLLYRRLGSQGRDVFRKTVALLMMADELFKEVGLLMFGNWTPDYIPLHLCNINLFMVTLHAFKPSKALGSYLYTVCLPGAMAAVLFPSWTVLPPGNFMHIHSSVAHILLVLYPVMLTVGGDIRPRLKELPGALLIVAAMAAVMFPINMLLGTNFFFLDHADPGNPLYLFEEAFGSHLIGFPVIVSGVLIVMHTPWAVYDAVQRKKARKLAEASAEVQE